MLRKLVAKIPPIVLHLFLFVLTLFTTTLAGAYWVGIKKIDDGFWEFFTTGFPYSLPFIGILTIHEFGHYLTAKYYKVNVSLPYFIPLFIPGLTVQIGTVGAIIKMDNRSASKKEIFDIGIAGPLAGFIASLIILAYGFTHLPEREHIFKVHPNYAIAEKEYGKKYENVVYNYQYFLDQYNKIVTKDWIRKDSLNYIKESSKTAFKIKQVFGLERPTWEAPKPRTEIEEFAVGKNLLILFFENYVVTDKSLIPNKYEFFHYPIIFAGLLALFFTALNLLPIGQLDGGHVIYGLFGFKNHKLISTSLFTVYILVAGLGIFKNNILEINVFNASFFDMLYFIGIYTYFLYLVFKRTYGDTKTVLMVCSIIIAIQFFVEYFIPTFEGFNGWLLFGLLIGRFLGTEHPPAVIEEPLDLKRKILGWFMLAVFVLCFTPQLFSIETIK